MARRRLSSLNLLRTFEAAARHLSFTLAGQELHITTSAVSQQVRNLEEQLGVELFLRQSRGLMLTAPGMNYWRTVQHHLRALDEATRRLTEPDDTPTLRVSLMPPLASRVVLPRFADFQRSHPDIVLHIDASLRNVGLARREADLAVRFGQPPWAGCLHEKLIDLQVLPVCPPSLADEYDLTAHPENLSRLPLIQMTERPDIWNQYFAFRGLPPPQPDQQFFVDDYPAAIEAAESVGVALALLPLEQPLIDSRRVVAPLPPIGPLPDAVYAVWDADCGLTPAALSFLDWLRAQLASLPAPRHAQQNEAAAERHDSTVSIQTRRGTRTSKQ